MRLRVSTLEPSRKLIDTDIPLIQQSYFNDDLKKNFILEVEIEY